MTGHELGRLPEPNTANAQVHRLAEQGELFYLFRTSRRPEKTVVGFRVFSRVIAVRA
jgi:hypothetical protein